MIRFLRTTNKRLLQGTVLLRLDFNTQDDWRMKAVIPTIKLLLSTSAKIIIVSHRGRPENVKIANGNPSGYEKSLSLKKDAANLSRFLRRKVIFVPHFRFMEVQKTVAAAPRGSVFLLENFRFLNGEEDNSLSLARSLATVADFYVNDAFAVDHRANASLVAITKFLPHYAGLELEKEMIVLGNVMRAPKHPLVFIIGGVKAAEKLAVIQYFKNKTDWFLLGGGSANTILALKGIDVENSVRDRDPKNLKALAALTAYKNIVLPNDFVWNDGMIWDIGPKAVKIFSEKIKAARSIFWSGPMGFIEKKNFSRGSIAIARAITKNRAAFSIAGGGETVMFLKKYGFDKKFSFISTGGGAMLDFLAGEKLPGIEALKK